MPFVNTAVHAVGVALFGYSLYYDLLYVYAPPELVAANPAFKAMGAWPGKWKYLTIWNVVIQVAYQVVALLNDFVGSNDLNTKRQTKLQKLRDCYFAAWVFPTGMFVCVAFWVLFYVDELLINMPQFVPDWINHMLHTAPLVAILLESFIIPHSRQRTVITFGALLFGYSAYVAWIVWVNQISDVWPYPFLSLMGTIERAIFIVAAGLVIFMFYFFGEALNKWRWANEVSTASHGKAKKKSK